MKKLKELNFNIDDLSIFFTLFRLDNSYLLMLSDQQGMGIGDVSLGSPPRIDGMKSTSASYNLFGMHRSLLSSVIAKRTSSILQKPVLILSFFKTDKEEDDFIKPLVNFVNETLENLKDK
ncbi:MAG: hypothetical protein GF317_17865, partial [Candidatus Lokiarchaeota archaeon]|nr:hypothetical protein [Candidatus Lokiarchaeota archaeon]MBD3201380.1 hypothetical protein [Candidatus Lokiarchaeota archaeon]